MLIKNIKNKTLAGKNTVTYWCSDFRNNRLTFRGYLTLAEGFHGYAAPGLLIGGKMIELARQNLPATTLFDALCETAFCLPDAVQLLTLCTSGNGWLKIENFGRFAVSLYDKYTGAGVRVYLNSEKLINFPEIQTWFFKLKPKNEQNSELLIEEIEVAGSDILSIKKIQINPKYLKKRSIGKTAACPVCNEAYPVKHGAICRACQGETPYLSPDATRLFSKEKIPVKTVPVSQAPGKKLLHDMTQIVPGKSKKVKFKKDQTVSVGDICRLQAMGRENIYVPDNLYDSNNWVHEDDAALRFASLMAGEGVIYDTTPSEGKLNFTALKDGILVVDKQGLKNFNSIPNVMCASRKNYTLMKKGCQFAGTRAIPLYIDKETFTKAVSAIADKPIFTIKPLRKKKVGILITGTEVFNGIIEDKFNEIIVKKVTGFACPVVESILVPDDREEVKKAVESLIEQGSELIVTTAGLSVDPDDVTKEGLINAGAENILYGIPVLPGAMSLIASIGNVSVIGTPACALYFKTTAFDILLPRLLADISISREDFSDLGDGSFCLQCNVCHYPRCSFGK